MQPPSGPARSVAAYPVPHGFFFLELLRPLLGRESWDHFEWRDLGISRRVLTVAVTDQLRPVYRKFKDWQTKKQVAETRP